ncbi:putative ribosomal RNA small subunit methyltransferase A [Candidatus Tiddalikarchaeum anstoanum]|nr:putative ribosomal RNA small subunit methyltransferase A [Candidatus Tiddalikarchaeum anstoanum]
MRKPRLSQVFLHNEDVLRRIAESANITKNDTVFEIGGGKGQLTKQLVNFAKKVIVCEIDKLLIPYLRELDVEIINESILDIDIPKEADVIVGNIPYRLSSDITEKVLRSGKKAVILYQKEFADRLVAKPSTNDYSRITILAQLLSTPKRLFNVSRNNFNPVPKVDSTLVEFTPKAEKYDEGFSKFTRILFEFKNKSVKNALINGRREWAGIEDKRKIRDLITNFTEKKVKDLSIEEIKDEYKKAKLLNKEFW